MNLFETYCNNAKCSIDAAAVPEYHHKRSRSVPARFVNADFSSVNTKNTADVATPLTLPENNCHTLQVPYLPIGNNNFHFALPSFSEKLKNSTEQLRLNSVRTSCTSFNSSVNIGNSNGQRRSCTGFPFPIECEELLPGKQLVRSESHLEPTPQESSQSDKKHDNDRFDLHKTKSAPKQGSSREDVCDLHCESPRETVENIPEDIIESSSTPTGRFGFGVVGPAKFFGNGSTAVKKLSVIEEISSSADGTGKSGRKSTENLVLPQAAILNLKTSPTNQIRHDQAEKIHAALRTWHNTTNHDVQDRYVNSSSVGAVGIVKEEEKYVTSYPHLQQESHSIQQEHQQHAMMSHEAVMCNPPEPGVTKEFDPKSSTAMKMRKVRSDKLLSDVQGVQGVKINDAMNKVSDGNCHKNFSEPVMSSAATARHGADCRFRMVSLREGIAVSESDILEGGNLEKNGKAIESVGRFPGEINESNSAVGFEGEGDHHQFSVASIPAEEYYNQPNVTIFSNGSSSVKTDFRDSVFGEPELHNPRPLELVGEKLVGDYSENNANSQDACNTSVVTTICDDSFTIFGNPSNMAHHYSKCIGTSNAILDTDHDYVEHKERPEILDGKIIDDSVRQDTGANPGRVCEIEVIEGSTNFRRDKLTENAACAKLQSGEPVINKLDPDEVDAITEEFLAHVRSNSFYIGTASDRRTGATGWSGGKITSKDRFIPVVGRRKDASSGRKRSLQRFRSFRSVSPFTGAAAVCTVDDDPIKAVQVGSFQFEETSAKPRKFLPTESNLQSILLENECAISMDTNAAREHCQSFLPQEESKTLLSSLNTKRILVPSPTDTITTAAETPVEQVFPCPTQRQQDKNEASQLVWNYDSSDNICNPQQGGGEDGTAIMSTNEMRNLYKGFMYNDDEIIDSVLQDFLENSMNRTQSCSKLNAGGGDIVESSSSTDNNIAGHNTVSISLHDGTGKFNDDRRNRKTSATSRSKSPLPRKKQPPQEKDSLRPQQQCQASRLKSASSATLRRDNGRQNWKCKDANGVEIDNKTVLTYYNSQKTILCEYLGAYFVLKEDGIKKSFSENFYYFRIVWEESTTETVLTRHLQTKKSVHRRNTGRNNFGATTRHTIDVTGQGQTLLVAEKQACTKLLMALPSVKDLILSSFDYNKAEEPSIDHLHERGWNQNKNLSYMVGSLLRWKHLLKAEVRLILRKRDDDSSHQDGEKAGSTAADASSVTENEDELKSAVDVLTHGLGSDSIGGGDVTTMIVPEHYHWGLPINTFCTDSHATPNSAVHLMHKSGLLHKTTVISKLKQVTGHDSQTDLNNLSEYILLQQWKIPLNSSNQTHRMRPHLSGSTTQKNSKIFETEKGSDKKTFEIFQGSDIPGLYKLIGENVRRLERLQNRFRVEFLLPSEETGRLISDAMQYYSQHEETWAENLFHGKRTKEDVYESDQQLLRKPIFTQLMNRYLLEHHSYGHNGTRNVPTKKSTATRHDYSREKIVSKKWYNVAKRLHEIEWIVYENCPALIHNDTAAKQGLNIVGQSSPHMMKSSPASWSPRGTISSTPYLPRTSSPVVGDGKPAVASQSQRRYNDKSYVEISDARKNATYNTGKIVEFGISAVVKERVLQRYRASGLTEEILAHNILVKAGVIPDIIFSNNMVSDHAPPARDSEETHIFEKIDTQSGLAWRTTPWVKILQTAASSSSKTSASGRLTAQMIVDFLIAYSRTTSMPVDLFVDILQILVWKVVGLFRFQNISMPSQQSVQSLFQQWRYGVIEKFVDSVHIDGRPFFCDHGLGAAVTEPVLLASSKSSSNTVEAAASRAGFDYKCYLKRFIKEIALRDAKILYEKTHSIGAMFVDRFRGKSTAKSTKRRRMIVSQHDHHPRRQQHQLQQRDILTITISHICEKSERIFAKVSNTRVASNPRSGTSNMKEVLQLNDVVLLVSSNYSKEHSKEQMTSSPKLFLFVVADIVVTEMLSNGSGCNDEYELQLQLLVCADDDSDVSGDVGSVEGCNVTSLPEDKQLCTEGAATNQSRTKSRFNSGGLSFRVGMVVDVFPVLTSFVRDIEKQAIYDLCLTRNPGFMVGKEDAAKQISNHASESDSSTYHVADRCGTNNIRPRGYGTSPQLREALYSCNSPASFPVKGNVEQCASQKGSVYLPKEKINTAKTYEPGSTTKNISINDHDAQLMDKIINATAVDNVIDTKKSCFNSTKPKVVIVTGEAGTGKTHIGGKIISEWCKHISLSKLQYSDHTGGHGNRFSSASADVVSLPKVLAVTGSVTGSEILARKLSKVKREDCCAAGVKPRTVKNDQLLLKVLHVPVETTIESIFRSRSNAFEFFGNTGAIDGWFLGNDGGDSENLKKHESAEAGRDSLDREDRLGFGTRIHQAVCGENFSTLRRDKLRRELVQKVIEDADVIVTTFCGVANSAIFGHLAEQNLVDEKQTQPVLFPLVLVDDCSLETVSSVAFLPILTRGCQKLVLLGEVMVPSHDSDSALRHPSMVNVCGDGPKICTGQTVVGDVSITSGKRRRDSSIQRAKSSHRWKSESTTNVLTTLERIFSDGSLLAACDDVSRIQVLELSRQWRMHPRIADFASNCRSALGLSSNNCEGYCSNGDSVVVSGRNRRISSVITQLSSSRRVLFVDTSGTNSGDHEKKLTNVDHCANLVRRNSCSETSSDSRSIGDAEFVNHFEASCILASLEKLFEKDCGDQQTVNSTNVIARNQNEVSMDTLDTPHPLLSAAPVTAVTATRSDVDKVAFCRAKFPIKKVLVAAAVNNDRQFVRNTSGRSFIKEDTTSLVKPVKAPPAGMMMALPTSNTSCNAQEATITESTNLTILTPFLAQKRLLQQMIRKKISFLDKVIDKKKARLLLPTRECSKFTATNFNHSSIRRSANDTELSENKIRSVDEYCRIREKWKQVLYNGCVSTVDDFRGQESDMVILSMVRSNKLGDIGMLSSVASSVNCGSISTPKENHESSKPEPRARSGFILPHDDNGKPDLSIEKSCSMHVGSSIGTTSIDSCARNRDGSTIDAITAANLCNEANGNSTMRKNLEQFEREILQNRRKLLLLDLFTRAKSELIIFGDAKTLYESSDYFWVQMLKWLNEKNSVISANEFRRSNKI